MKRIFLISIGIVASAFAIVFFVQHMISKPMYDPGMVRSDASLELAPMRQTSNAPFWQVEKDIKIYRFSQGSGKNVLTIHGGPGYPVTEPYPGLEPLTSSYRFWYYHQRGCGQSTRPIDRFESNNYYNNLHVLERTLGLTAQIADIERIRQILGEEKLILIGHSFGAFIAALYAVEFPENVAGLVLVAPANVLKLPQDEDDLFEAIGGKLPEEMVSEYNQYLERYFDFAGFFEKDDAYLTLLNAELLRYYNAAFNDKSSILPVSDNLNNGGWMVQALYFSMGMKHDYREALKQVSAPTLVIHGNDDFQSEKASRQYSDWIPNAEFSVIKNSGHLPFDEQPVAFATLVGEFLSSI
jgi:proline iminopeptidase